MNCKDLKGSHTMSKRGILDSETRQRAISKPESTAVRQENDKANRQPA